MSDIDLSRLLNSDGPAPGSNARDIQPIQPLGPADRQIVDLLIACEPVDNIAALLGCSVQHIIGLKERMRSYLEAERARRAGKRIDGTPAPAGSIAARPAEKVERSVTKPAAATKPATKPAVTPPAAHSTATAPAIPKNTGGCKPMNEKKNPEISPAALADQIKSEHAAAVSRAAVMTEAALPTPILRTCQQRFTGENHRYTITGNRLGIDGGALMLDLADLDSFIAEIMEARTIMLGNAKRR